MGYDLSNIFESFLPQLLTYPNPTDPLNGDAAAMFLHRPEEYKKKVSEYVRKYASEEALRQNNDGGVSSSSESSMSDYSEDEAQVRTDLWNNLQLPFQANLKLCPLLESF